MVVFLFHEVLVKLVDSLVQTRDKLLLGLPISHEKGLEGLVKVCPVRGVITYYAQAVPQIFAIAESFLLFWRLMFLPKFLFCLAETGLSWSRNTCLSLHSSTIY